ncbi:hypothetical protein ACFV7R_38575 [Streptomyces sp. NPDC059866]|uniref:hypothetical protein n=1 Tax=Streptomyces sp. NPDC059866 TaxID=3346978 RepID=UPI003666308C
MVPGEAVRVLTTENTSLKRRRVQQLAREHRSLQERLEGARSNNRFAEKRIADLEVQILELQQGVRAQSRQLAPPSRSPPVTVTGLTPPTASNHGKAVRDIG